jgi:phthalate 4,5-cis-dihydrodiol dehydrogenase
MKVKIGLVGLGDHMLENLFPTFRLAPQVEIIAACSRSEEKSRDFVAAYSLQHSFSSWQEMLESKSVDAVVVAATPRVHEEVIASSISNGIHVFCEKPPARTKASVDRLSRLEDKVVCFIDYNFRFGSLYKTAAELIKKEGGAVGVQIHFVTNKPVQVRWDNSSLLESFLLSIAVHPLDIIISTFGPVAIFSWEMQWVGSNRFALHLSITFQNGLKALLHLGNYSNTFENNIRFFTKQESVVSILNCKEITFR